MRKWYEPVRKSTNIELWDRLQHIHFASRSPFWPCILMNKNVCIRRFWNISQATSSRYVLWANVLGVTRYSKRFTDVWRGSFNAICNRVRDDCHFLSTRTHHRVQRPQRNPSAVPSGKCLNSVSSLVRCLRSFASRSRPFRNVQLRTPLSRPQPMPETAFQSRSSRAII